MINTIKRNEVLSNRRKVINFLKVKGRKKAVGSLDNGDGARCCLGHACYILGVEKHPLFGTDFFTSKQRIIGYTYGLDKEEGVAPDELIRLVGFWDSNGTIEDKYGAEIMNGHTDLVSVNDDEGKRVSPNRIGAYLELVIEGGENTPWRPLSEYEE